MSKLSNADVPFEDKAAVARAVRAHSFHPAPPEDPKSLRGLMDAAALVLSKDTWVDMDAAAAEHERLTRAEHDDSLKPTNPKDAIGSDKLPFHLWPETASALGCLGMLDGALKYGRSNFRALGIRASIYYDATRRHLNKWFEGEDTDPDSGLPHLAHALACIAIIVDAQAAGQFTDDRMHPGGYVNFLKELTPHVNRLKDLHQGKHPHHYTIARDLANVKDK